MIAKLLWRLSILPNNTEYTRPSLCWSKEYVFFLPYVVSPLMKYRNTGRRKGQLSQRQTQELQSNSRDSKGPIISEVSLNELCFSSCLRQEP